MHRFLTAKCLLLAIAVLHPAIAQNANTSSAGEPAYGPELEGYTYPYPMHEFQFSSQKQILHMAYMDVQPNSFNGQVPNGQVVVLLHGKNFCSATWKATIDFLANAGYRVIAVDQIGFCKSTKPQAYQYTFQQLALGAAFGQTPAQLFARIGQSAIHDLALLAAPGMKNFHSIPRA